ncbi:MAG: DUF1643 domain-containing protein [Synergistaceae bacterium]|nr:DUF1643 domain-containing protein [Synergistaceae bacterium]
MLTEKVLLKTETVFSDDRRNRYLLRKEWDAKKPRATIIMTNPSAADLMTMDYTTLYILNNISKLDFGAVDIVNLSSRITTKLNASEDLGLDIEKENAEFIVKSAEKSDKVIIAWGKIGDDNKKVRAVQDKLLAILKPFKDKLFCIASSEEGDSGFHPLAPQIRSQWVLKAFIPSALPEQTEKNKTANNKPALNVPAQSPAQNPS